MRSKRLRSTRILSIWVDFSRPKVHAGSVTNHGLRLWWWFRHFQILLKFKESYLVLPGASNHTRLLWMAPWLCVGWGRNCSGLLAEGLHSRQLSRLCTARGCHGGPPRCPSRIAACRSEALLGRFCSQTTALTVTKDFRMSIHAAWKQSSKEGPKSCCWLPEWRLRLRMLLQFGACKGCCQSAPPWVWIEPPTLWLRMTRRTWACHQVCNGFFQWHLREEENVEVLYSLKHEMFSRIATLWHVAQGQRHSIVEEWALYQKLHGSFKVLFRLVRLAACCRYLRFNPVPD